MRHRESAQSAAEFALLAPVLLLVVIGIIQMGYVFGKQLDLKSATADGARRAAVSINAADPKFLATMTVKDRLALSDESSVSVTVTPSPPWEHGQHITVSTRIPHAYNILGVASWSGDLRARSEIRVE